MVTECSTVDSDERIELPPLPSRKVRLTVNLPKDLVEQMRDAVYWTPGLTLAWLIARAMQTSLTELHSTNRGPFPKRSRPLRAGRPRLTGQTMTVHMRQPVASPHQLSEPMTALRR
ncbi:MAG TPA: hypothetical protein VJ746_20015 [Nitrospira sp.]|nr:hypothetical protein [Nitrospira sp.]